jgi:hypothetical protein
MNWDPGEAPWLRVSLTDAEEQELARESAAALAKDGYTAAWLREQPAEEGDARFWERVAAELDAIEARQGLSVLPGEASRHPLAVRLAASAAEHAEPPPWARDRSLCAGQRSAPRLGVTSLGGGSATPVPVDLR